MIIAKIKVYGADASKNAYGAATWDLTACFDGETGEIYTIDKFEDIDILERVETEEKARDFLADYFKNDFYKISFVRGV